MYLFRVIFVFSFSFSFQIVIHFLFIGFFFVLPLFGSNKYGRVLGYCYINHPCLIEKINDFASLLHFLSFLCWWCMCVCVCLVLTFLPLSAVGGEHRC